MARHANCDRHNFTNVMKVGYTNVTCQEETRNLFQMFCIKIVKINSVYLRFHDITLITKMSPTYNIPRLVKASCYTIPLHVCRNKSSFSPSSVVNGHTLYLPKKIRDKEYHLKVVFVWNPG